MAAANANLLKAAAYRATYAQPSSSAPISNSSREAQRAKKELPFEFRGHSKSGEIDGRNVFPLSAYGRGRHFFAKAFCFSQLLCLFGQLFFVAHITGKTFLRSTHNLLDTKLIF